MVRGIIFYTILIILLCWIRFYRHLPRHELSANLQPEIRQGASHGGEARSGQRGERSR